MTLEISDLLFHWPLLRNGHREAQRRCPRVLFLGWPLRNKVWERDSSGVLTDHQYLICLLWSEGKGCMHISICVKNEKILKTYAVISFVLTLFHTHIYSLYIISMNIDRDFRSYKLIWVLHAVHDIHNSFIIHIPAGSPPPFYFLVFMNNSFPVTHSINNSF